MSGQDRPVRAVVDGRLPEFGEGDPDTVFANAVARAELRVAAARAERDALLDFARRAARLRPEPGASEDFARGALMSLAGEAERLILTIAGEGPS